MGNLVNEANASVDLPVVEMDQVDFLVVDVETTGLSAGTGDRICEVGAVKLRGGAIIDSFGSLINPERPISPGAYAVNRISPQMVAEAPVFRQVAGRLAAMMENSVLVAYNAGFDCSFLSAEFRLAGCEEPRCIVIDALALARQLLPGLGRYPQGNVAAVLGIPFPVQHRAVEDATVTARLLMHFIATLKSYDCKLLSDLLRTDLTYMLHSKRLTLINDALRTKHNLWVKYLSPAESRITDRIVSPKECVQEGSGRSGATYLVAYCHSAGADRNFRIDRMLDLRVVEPVI